MSAVLDHEPGVLKRSVFKTSRLLEFCSKRELVAQTGQPVEAWPLVVLKELVDNALDEAEEIGVPPCVNVAVSTADGTIVVADNGRGMPAELVTDLLDFSSRTSSKEAYVSPTRGQQGNALSTILPMPFVLGSERDVGGVTIEACGVAHEIAFKVDPIAQEPNLSRATSASSVKTGTRLTVRWPQSACSILDDAEDQFLQIATAFAWLNPHLSLDIAWNGKRFAFEALAPTWPKWKPSDPTCPHWYDQQRIERLIGARVVHDRRRDRHPTVREFIAGFRGLSGTAKQKAVLDEIGAAREPLSSLVREDGFDKAKVAALLRALQAATKPVKPQQLGLIGREVLSRRCIEAGAEIDSFTYSKELGVTDGVPWAVECCFAWCPGADDRRLVTGVNWSPGVTNPFRALGRFGESLDTILANQRASRNEPVVVFLHLACPRVEYTDRGKSAVVVSGDGE